MVGTAHTARGEVAGISLDGAQVAAYEYNLVGRTTAKTLENGIRTTFGYDAAHRLTRMEHRRGNDLLTAFGYTLDKVGNRTSKEQTGLNPLIEIYAYDAVDQLVQASYGGARTVAYQYDRVGNRQNVTENGRAEAYTVNADNGYTSVGGENTVSDANGNLATAKSGVYAYDAQNRLVSASVNGTTTTFGYDPRNRVVRRSVNGTESHLSYSGWDLIEERDGSGALVGIYVHGAGTDELLVKVDRRGAAYYHQDGLGSTVALTGPGGALIESCAYDAFGAATVRDAAGRVVAESVVGNRFLFTGREWLAQAGLYDYRNRVYSAELGRFLQTDPIRFAAGDVNVYRYCGNNAPNSTDAWGLNPEAVTGTGYDRHRVNPKKKARSGDAIRHPGKTYDNNCAAGAQHETGTDTTDAPSTNDWERGYPFSSQTPEGTMLSNGWVPDSSKQRGYKYPNKSSGNHTVTSAGNKNGVPHVREQFVGKNGNGISMRERPMNPDEGYHEVWTKSGTQGPRSSGYSGAPLTR